MTPVAGAISTVALGVLAVAGVAKILRPTPTQGALRAARLPASPTAVRLLGAGEAAAAAAGLVMGGVWLGGASIVYAGLAGFTWMALARKIPVQTCGCFGVEDTPPTRIHLAFNIVALTALAIGALAGVTPVPGDEAMTVVLYLGFGVLGTYLALLLLTGLPRTLAAADTR